MMSDCNIPYAQSSWLGTFIYIHHMAMLNCSYFYVDNISTCLPNLYSKAVHTHTVHIMYTEMQV